MPYTKEQIAENNQNMFGCTTEDLEATFNSALGPKEMLAMQILSDAQEVQEHSPELANQYINRAKWVLSEIIRRKLGG